MAATILIIEDEAGIADSVTYALRSEGFQTSWCTTGAEGLAIIAREPISLIVLDVGLPDVSGFDLFREIRQFHPIPVIFLTARASEVDRVVGLEIGADDYVVKPFSPRELTARVRAVLRRAASGPEAPRLDSSTPFRLVEHKNVITYYGEPLRLSHNEFRLLKILISHPGWVYSREQLMAAAWEDPDASLERTVDAHIKQLRRKLRAIKPGIDPIVTHRSCGYSLKENW